LPAACQLVGNTWSSQQPLIPVSSH